jgi:hypothetical protein
MELQLRGIIRQRLRIPIQGLRRPIYVNELIEQLKSRVGLDDNKAHSAAQTVIEFLKQRLPGPIASQVESALSGGGVEGMKDTLGGVFGKKSA